MRRIPRSSIPRSRARRRASGESTSSSRWWEVRSLGGPRSCRNRIGERPMNAISGRRCAPAAPRCRTWARARSGAGFRKSRARRASSCTWRASGARERRSAQLQHGQGGPDRAGPRAGARAGPSGRAGPFAGPGSILHPGGSWERRQKEDPAAIAAFVKREIPFGRFGTAEEVGDTIAFLVSARASWIAGACVVVDGAQSRSF